MKANRSLGYCLSVCFWLALTLLAGVSAPHQTGWKAPGLALLKASQTLAPNAPPMQAMVSEQIATASLDEEGDSVPAGWWVPAGCAAPASGPQVSHDSPLLPARYPRQQPQAPPSAHI